VPGADVDLMDIYITRFAVTISRKVGVFEQQHLMPKFKPLQFQRMAPENINQFVREQITLPCAVQPTKKQAFTHKGTVFLALEKLGESVDSVHSLDWQADPSF